MVIAEAGDFVPATGNFGNQLRHLLGDPAKHKEGRFRVVLVEQLERPLSISFDPRFESVPLLLFDQPSEGAHLKPVLDSDCQDVLAARLLAGHFRTRTPRQLSRRVAMNDDS